MMTAEELEALATGETLFASPIPVQSVSSDEFSPAPQTARQREFEARVKRLGSALARRQGLSRRAFFKTAGGMAAAFVAMNETYAKGSAPLYEILKNEEKTPNWPRRAPTASRGSS